MINKKGFKNNVIPGLAAFFVSFAAFGQGMNEGANYKIPSSPELHEKSDLNRTAKDDGAGFVIGAGTNFGLANVAGEDDSAQTSYTLGLEIGYNSVNRDDTRMEIGADIFTGKLSSKNDDIKGDANINVGFMAKLGYGLPLGGTAVFVPRIGAGIAIIELESEIGGDTYKSSDTSNAVLLAIGGDLVVPFKDQFEFVIGAEWSQYQFSVDSFDDPNGNKIPDSDEDLVMNFMSVGLGFRAIL